MAEKSLSANSIIASMEEIFMKFPALPVKAKEVIVAIAPWLALVFGAIGVLGTIAATGIVTFLSPFVALGGGVGVAAGSMVFMLLALAQSVLTLVATPGLFARKMQGWNFLFWSEILAVISAIITISLSGIIFTIIGFYILFQVKSYYK